MRKYIAFLVVSVLFLNCAITYTIRDYHRDYHDYKRKKPIIISNRVGEIVDPEEREKFDLFHGIAEFKSATFYEITDGGYEVEILTEQAKLVAVNRADEAVTILRDYFDRYEEICESRKEFEEKWDIIDYDDLGQPIMWDEYDDLYGVRSYFRGCCPYGGIFSIVGGAIGLLIVLETVVLEYDVDPALVLAAGTMIGVLGGGIIGLVVGKVIGGKPESDKIVATIKQAREPRVVEER